MLCDKNGGVSVSSIEDIEDMFCINNKRVD